MKCSEKSLLRAISEKELQNRKKVFQRKFAQNNFYSEQKVLIQNGSRLHCRYIGRSIYSYYKRYSPLGAFPTRAQIQVLSPNRSFSGTTKIPNSFEIPKNYFDFKFCISLILISGNEVTEFRSFYFTKSKFLQTIIFTKILSYTASFICFQCTACILER